MKSKIKIGILGGGSVGLFAANVLIDDLPNVTIDIIEKDERVGKKILATGNGKCNFTNNNIDYFNYNNDDFAKSIIDRFNVDKTLEYFSSLGLVYKFDEEGRGYPLSESSLSVVDVLNQKLKNKVNFLLNSKVNKIEYNPDKIKIFYNKTFSQYDYVIIATGNIASNLVSLDTNAYLNSLKIKNNDLKPSLVSFITTKSFKKITGQRIKCFVSLYSNNEVVKKEYGEVIFKEDGIGGIVILQMSHFYNRNENNYIQLDLTPTMSGDELIKYFNNKSEWLVEDIFTGLINKKVSNFLLEEITFEYKNKTIKQLKEKEIIEIVKVLKEYKILIKSTQDFKFAQVVSGGINTSEVSNNLELINYPRIYVGGEILNIDGICGGYNLQFAWSSAKVIAQNLIEKCQDF